MRFHQERGKHHDEERRGHSTRRYRQIPTLNSHWPPRARRSDVLDIRVRNPVRTQSHEQRLHDSGRLLHRPSTEWSAQRPHIRLVHLPIVLRHDGHHHRQRGHGRKVGEEPISKSITVRAFNSRCDFKAYCLFSLSNTIIYAIPAGWVWGECGFLRELGAVDIAGSGPVHLIGTFQSCGMEIVFNVLQVGAQLWLLRLCWDRVWEGMTVEKVNFRLGIPLMRSWGCSSSGGDGWLSIQGVHTA